MKTGVGLMVDSVAVRVSLPSAYALTAPLQADAERDLRLARGYYREGFTERAIRHFQRVVENGNPTQREEALFLVKMRLYSILLILSM